MHTRAEKSGKTRGEVRREVRVQPHLTKIKRMELTDRVCNSVSCVSSLENEDGSVRVLGEAGGDGEACGTTTDDNEVVGVGDLAIVDDIAPTEVLAVVVVVDVAMAGVEGCSERCGGDEEGQEAHRGRDGEEGGGEAEEGGGKD